MEIFRSLLHLFYPDVCLACEYPLLKEEQFLCLSCHYELPKTAFHLSPGNALEQRFWGRIPIEKAASLYYFSKHSKAQNIVHNIKYRGMKAAAREIGCSYGAELKAGGGFENIDLIIPVPLHKKKERSRGFNQSTWFGIGLSASLGIPIEDKLLIRTSNTRTQTHKSREERLKNVENVFSITNAEEIAGKHILLIDDVVTTGSTLEACAKTILNCGADTKISIATIAFAS